MNVIDHAKQPIEEWRPGVTTHMRVSALTRAAQLTIFDQWCTAGLGAPTHRHEVEEVLSVIEGEAQIWVEDDSTTVRAGQSVVIPPGSRHGFRNSGESLLHVQATLAAPVFEATYDDRSERSRRWEP